MLLKVRALLQFVVLVCVFKITIQRSTPEDDSYVAGVVEFEVNPDEAANMNRYEEIIKQAAEQDVDILVFPEMTLTRGTKVPVPFHGILKNNAPADRPELFHEILVRSSKAARESQIYILFNVEEEMDCTETVEEEEYCPENKTYYFNTNVIFDRNGSVIDRYRKMYLFGEYGRTPALRPELGTFTTDFGVTFGHYICFDLMFQVPAIQVVEKLNITDVLFSTMWFSALPYLTAVQIQEAYAYSMNINFIASGSNNVHAGSAGSGIFSGKQGALVSRMPGLPETQLYVARVPKVPGQANWTVPGPQYSPAVDHDNLFLLTDPSLTAHVTRLLVSGYQEFTLVDNELTCKFRIWLNQTVGETYYYRAGAFDGIRNYSGYATGGTRICGVFSCTGTTKDTCGKRYAVYKPGVVSTFSQLDIIAVVPTPKVDHTIQSSDSVYFPVTLLPSILPMEPATGFVFNSTENEGVSEYTMSLLDFQQELYSFTIWGRVYEKDGQDPTGPLDEEEDNSTPEKHDDILLIFVVLLFAIFI